MAGFHAVYYRDRQGIEPVRAFISGLDEKAQESLDGQIDRLNMLTDEVPHLPFLTARKSRGSWASSVATTVDTCTASSTAARID